jgi:hypothetical protein
MDIRETIESLKYERQRLVDAIDYLDRAIAMLESLSGPPAATRRAGRKSMGAEERREVSLRMKKYWASRRKARGEGA